MLVHNCSRCAWLAALFVSLATEAPVLAQISPVGSIAANLARAQWHYDNGNYRQAAIELEPLVREKLSGPLAPAEVAAASRLLAQVYYRSSDFTRASQIAERYAGITQRTDPEILVILADSYRALGRYDDARRQLDMIHAMLGDSASQEGHDIRLVIDARRTAAAVERALPARTSIGDGTPTDAVDYLDQLDLSADRFQGPQRYYAVVARVNSYLGANRLGDAIALLVNEHASPAYDAGESTELKLRLADCYSRQAALPGSAGDAKERNTAIEAEQRILDSLEEEVIRQLSRAGRTSDAASWLARQGTILESKGKLSGGAANKHLWKAAECYERLLHYASAWSADSEASRVPGHDRQPDVTHLGNEYHDVALCGLQRVYDELRVGTSGGTDQQLASALCTVSDQLVAARSQRLLPGDPALYDAQLAQASVYASIDDRESHRTAERIYRALISDLETSSRPNPEFLAAVLVGQAEMLRSLGQIRSAHYAALRARKLIDEVSTEIDDDSRRRITLLAARIENCLGVILTALGEYRDALKWLTSADQRLRPYSESAGELRRSNEQLLHVLSRAKVYRALLHKAEAKYGEAARRVQEGRRLREQLEANADLLAYFLAEASIHLAHASAMRQERQSADNPAVRAAIANAEAALDRAGTLVAGDGMANRPQAADLPYRYLRGLLSRLRGDGREAHELFVELADDAQTYGDQKIAATSYLQLAQLTVDARATRDPHIAEAHRQDGLAASRAQAIDLRTLKLARRAQIQQAVLYAERAVSLFHQINPDELSPEARPATPLPSLHFQALYLAARLYVLLNPLDDHIAKLDNLLADTATHTQSRRTDEAESLRSDSRQRAIDLLEDAVRQAERPASTTTHVRLQRAKFFSRYAPAYDLLVDQYVAAAIDAGRASNAGQQSPAYPLLRRAIEVADMARNRTFREQIEGWRQSSGVASEVALFNWQHLPDIIEPETVLLIYHLNGRQLLDAGRAQQIGSGHLFVVLSQGSEIRYYPLQHAEPGVSTAAAFTRETAAQLVRRHIEWIESPESSPDWGLEEQRALSDCLLPEEVLALIAPAHGRNEAIGGEPDGHSAARVRQILIIPDGALHQLPFESLLLPQSFVGDDRKLRYVIDDLPPIRYGPSLSVLGAVAKSERPGTDGGAALLTVGNPAYPPPTRQNKILTWKELLEDIPRNPGGFAALQHSQDEIDSVYASFDDLPSASRTKLVQAAATEQAVRQHISSSRFIHIAAHGCVDYNNDNLSGALVFAPGDGPDDPDDDGLLQLREIYSLDLGRCELAVLSACQTYAGPARPLEAGTSMARAFLEQGANRVVCSQWSTYDRAAGDFMKVFFGSIRSAREAGQAVDYPQALHDAKLAIRRDPARASSVRLWSAFVLVGAP